MVKRNHEGDDKYSLLKHKHYKIQQTFLHTFKIVWQTRKITKFTRFPKSKWKKGRPISKSRIWNKINKNKNIAHAKQKSNKNLLQRINKT